MKRKTNFKTEIVRVLKDISEIRPTTRMATHIASALADYPVYDSISDKEFLHILEKYRCIIELDLSIQHDEDIEDILRNGMDLQSSLNDEDESEIY